MMEKIRPGAGKAGLAPQPHDDYGRLEIDLATARTNEELNIQGDYIAKIKYDGTETGCYFKIDHRHAAKIYAKEFKALRRRYARLFLTNTAQAGKVFVIQINELSVSEIEPDDIGKLADIETATEETAEAIKVDDAAFTPGTDKVIMTGAEFDDTTPDSVDEGDAGALRMSGRRALHVEIRDGEGNERSAYVNTQGDLLTRDANLDVYLNAIETSLGVMDDWDDADYCKVVGSLMSTDKLIVEGDGVADTIAAPGEGNAIEVLGYQINEYEDAAFVVDVEASLAFAGVKEIWTGVFNSCGAKKNNISIASGLRIRGNTNQALTLTNADRSAGASSVNAVIYYRVIVV